jgi:hypothetical protein
MKPSGSERRQALRRGGGAGRDLLIMHFLPKRSVCSQRPGAVKGAPFWGAAQRTLDGEDRGDRIEEGGKSSGLISFHLYFMEDNSEP